GAPGPRGPRCCDQCGFARASCESPYRMLMSGGDGTCCSPRAPTQGRVAAQDQAAAEIGEMPAQVPPPPVPALQVGRTVGPRPAHNSRERLLRPPIVVGGSDCLEVDGDDLGNCNQAVRVVRV